MITTDIKEVHRIAAFSENGAGGNPAGVLVGDSLPPDTEMQAIAGAVGYSETAFASPEGDHWRVRYFAPESEVDFYGHATGAAAAALAGYLRDLGWPHGGSIDITQGADMGTPFKLKVTIPDEPGSPVRVSGSSRKID
ncbi:MAG: PhzF family phenazine biosynthesis protein [Rhodobacteraceae bacterium]|nr:PhzF family phenazine biosynthesis protein [Paracoccaceae bacterium]